MRIGLILVLAAAGCSSDDGFIATNELPPEEDAGSGGAGAVGGNGATGGSGATGGGGGSSAAGGASAAGGVSSGGQGNTGGTTGECTPGQTEDVGDCAMCGVNRRTCDANGEWGAAECVDQGECTPSATDSSGCSGCGSRTCQNDCTWGTCSGGGTCTPGATRQGSCTNCLEQVCGNDCQWGACQLKGSAGCDYIADDGRPGARWRCCGSGSWQFCLDTCQWSTACAACSSCSC